MSESVLSEAARQLQHRESMVMMARKRLADAESSIAYWTQTLADEERLFAEAQADMAAALHRETP